jgi:hypothetical protein
MDAFIAYVDIERAILQKDDPKINAAAEVFRNTTKANSIYYIDPEYSIFDLLKPYYIANNKAKYLEISQKYLSSRYPLQRNLFELKTGFKGVFDYNYANVEVAETDSIANPEEYKKNLAESQLNSYLAEDLNNTVWSIYENTEDANLLKTLLPYAKLSIDLNESYYNVDTYAHLLDKTGEHKKAIWLQKKSTRLAKFYASEGELASADEELEKFSTVFKQIPLKPMAFDKTTLENHIEHYLHYNMMLDYEKLTEFMPPYFLTQFPKEQLKKELQSAYENEEVFVNIDKADLKIGSDLISEKDKTFAKLNMLLEMTIDLSKMVNASGDPVQRKTMMDNVTKQYATMYGKGNFTLDESKAQYKIKTKSAVYAIGDKTYDTWKFINFEEKLKGVIDQIVPENIRDKLK